MFLHGYLNEWDDSESFGTTESPELWTTPEVPSEPEEAASEVQEEEPSDAFGLPTVESPEEEKEPSEEEDKETAEVRT